MLTRAMRNMQAVVMCPLTKHGAEFTAGIQGHRGLVYGDKLGELKKLSNSISEGWWGIFPSLLNIRTPTFIEMNEADLEANKQADNLFLKNVKNKFPDRKVDVTKPVDLAKLWDYDMFTEQSAGVSYATVINSCHSMGTLGSALLLLLRMDD
jgi:hypothetical protein